MEGSFPPLRRASLDEFPPTLAKLSSHRGLFLFPILGGPLGSKDSSRLSLFAFEAVSCRCGPIFLHTDIIFLSSGLSEAFHSLSLTNLRSNSTLWCRSFPCDLPFDLLSSAQASLRRSFFPLNTSCLLLALKCERRSPLIEIGLNVIFLA